MVPLIFGVSAACLATLASIRYHVQITTDIILPLQIMCAWLVGMAGVTAGERGAREAGRARKNAPSPAIFSRADDPLPWCNGDLSIHTVLPSMAGLDPTYGGASDNIYTRCVIPWLCRLASTMARDAKRGTHDHQECVDSPHNMFVYTLWGSFTPSTTLPSVDLCMLCTDAWRFSRTNAAKGRRCFFMRQRQGYLKIDLGNGTYEYAHRVVCWAFNGPPPSYVLNGVEHHMEVCHTCHNSNCLNPRHLKWGTGAQNAFDFVWDKLCQGRKYWWGGMIQYV